MFSKKGTYPAVGLFSVTHIISIIICLVLIAILVNISKGMSKEKYFTIIKRITIVATIMEIFDIAWTIVNGTTKVRNWLPLYFCSLYIYSMWATWSSNRFIRDCGLAFFSMGCIVAGVAFIFFPTTSYASYPVFHYKSLYSMIFHMAMVYTGIMCYMTKAVDTNIHTVLKYIIFCLVFMFVGLVLNYIFDANFMFLSNPSNIPLPILNTIYSFSPLLYTMVIIVSHLSLGPLTLLVCLLINKIPKIHFAKEIPIYDNLEEIEPIYKEL